MTVHRRRKKPVNEGPLFEEPTPQPPTICRVPNCSLPAIEAGLCALHVVLAAGRERLEKQAAASRKDPLTSLLAQAGATLLELATPWVGTVVARATSPQAAAPPKGAPQPKPRAVDPFTVLGLDAATATVTSVRKMQQKLAMIYHADKGGDAAAARKLAEINAAATEAIRQLTAK